MRSVQPALLLITKVESLAAERVAFELSEYVDGQVYVMAGESLTQNLTRLRVNILTG